MQSAPGQEVSDFRRLLRMVLAIERPALEAAGLIGRDDRRSWNEFRRDPMRWVIRLGDAQALALWRLMQEARQRAEAATEPRRPP